MRTGRFGRFVVAGLALAGAAGSTLAQTPANVCAQAPTINVAGSYVGSTVGFTADGTSTCGSNSAPDAWIRFVSPVTGQIRFDTCSPATNFDTIIAVRTSCPGSGSQLACNDDAVAGFCATDPNGEIGTSRAFANLAAGQIVFVRIGAALPGISGNFVLNITTPPPPPPPTLGPDVTVFNLTDVARTGAANNEAGVNVTAYAVGTESCNRGDVPVAWYDAPGARENLHPVIAQNVFRLKSSTQNGTTFQRFEQLGQSWLKHGFLSVNGNACGTCVQPPDGGDQLGINCSDPYGSGLNGDPGLLGSRSRVNAATGFFAMPVVKGNSTGNAAIRGRAQVPTADVVSQPAGTRFFVDAQYVTQDDHQHVRPNQTVATNALNNATWREINIQAGTGTPSFIGGNRQQEPGIFAWRAIDAGVTLVSADHDDVANPNAFVFPNTTLRGRFWVAGKATSLGNGLWRYEYAIYNLTSDRGAGGFSVPFPSDGVESDFYFRHPHSHSGEPYSNAAWTMTKANGRLNFSTETFAANNNANAIRWSTMYNIGFTSNVAPTTGNASINLFKPGTVGAPDSIDAVNLPVPTVPPSCAADFNGDSNVDPDDLSDYIACYFSQPPCEAADINGDFNVDPDDLSDFIGIFFGGC